MSFVLAHGETLGAGLRRVIDEQVAKLSAECVDAIDHASSFAHKARVRTKRVRSALRLAAPLMPGKVFKHENRWWRDGARLLSELRDAGARLEALEALRPFLEAKIGTAMTRKLGEHFEGERQSVDAAAAIDAFRARMAERRGDLVPKLPAGDDAHLAEALGETYRLSRRAMKGALETADPLLLHEWRKQTKYHALQQRLVAQVFSPAVAPRVAATRALAEQLGEVQDIEVVIEGAKTWQEAPRTFADVLDARRAALVAEAKVAGEGLFAGKAKAWTALLSRAQAAAAPVDP